MENTMQHRASWFRRPGWLLLAVLVIMVLATNTAWADDGAQAAQNYKDFLTLFMNTAQHWTAPLRTIAATLFWGLAFIELNVAFWPLALQGATLGEFVWAMVKLILFLGFFYALVLNGAEWMTDIIQSFSMAGAQAGGASGQITPVAMLAEGLRAALKILNATSFFSPFSNIGLELSALILLVCFIVIAAILGLLLLESYITIGAATIFFAFGGCRFSSDYARHTFQSAITIGAKLFLIQLLAASANPLVEQWVAAYHADNANTLGLIALCGIFALACAMIPSVVNRLLGGAGSGGALGAVMGAAGMAAGVASAGMAASALASAQMGAGAAAGAAEGSAMASLASASTTAPGGLPDAVASMPGMKGEGWPGETSSGAGGGSTASMASSGTSPAGGQASASSPPSAGRPASTGSAQARASSSGASVQSGGSTSSSSGEGGGSGISWAQAREIAAQRAASAGQAGTPAGGTGSAGEHAARTVANFAGHMAKHIGSANPGHAAASEMNSKADALSGSVKPGAPEPEPPMATAGAGTISGGAKLDPEQPLSGDKAPPENTAAAAPAPPSSGSGDPAAPPAPPSQAGEAADPDKTA